MKTQKEIQKHKNKFSANKIKFKENKIKKTIGHELETHPRLEQEYVRSKCLVVSVEHPWALVSIHEHP